MNMSIQGFTGVYIGEHENTGVYMGVHENTGFTEEYSFYMGVHENTGVNRSING